MKPVQPLIFDAVAPFQGEAILAPMEDFQGGRCSDSVHLSIGVYFDGEGRLPTLDSVRLAEAALLAEERPRGYLPLEGLADYREAAQRLRISASHEALRNEPGVHLVRSRQLCVPGLATRSVDHVAEAMTAVLR